jgi:hypothetical protein
MGREIVVKFKHQAKDYGQLVIRSVGSICRSSSERFLCSVLIYKLIRTFRPAKCLELGTCLGISAAYQAAALTLNGGGQIVTLEGAESLAGLSAQHFKKLGLENVRVVVGRFQDTLDQILNESGSFDFAFIDWHHTKTATLNYFKTMLHLSRKMGLYSSMILSWSRGMRQAWRRIKSDSRVKMAVNLWQIGVCIIDNTHEA